MTKTNLGSQVKRSIHKGTDSISVPIGSSNWAGKSFKEYQKASLSQAVNSTLVISKGTKIIRLLDVKETKIPSVVGRHLSSARGTSIRIG